MQKAGNLREAGVDSVAAIWERFRTPMILMATPTNSVMRVAGLIVLFNAVETEKFWKDALCVQCDMRATARCGSLQRRSFHSVTLAHAMLYSRAAACVIAYVCMYRFDSLM
jgi:hypothetical protein